MSWVIKAEEELKETTAREQVGEYFTSKKCDHKCGVCKLRVILDKTDIADCTKVRGGISLTKGSCNLWNYSEEPSSKKDIADSRLNYEDSGYVETPTPDFPIWCSTCTRYKPEEQEEDEGQCLLFMKKVDGPYCCAGFDNPDVKTPEQTHLKDG